MSRSVILDSSIWIEIFRDGPLATASKKILSTNEVAGIPTVVIFEIYRKIAKEVSEDSALSAVAYLKTFAVLNLDVEVALTAADIALAHKLGMADSIVLAHAQCLESRLVTLDNDFAGIPGVEVIRKR